MKRLLLLLFALSLIVGCGEKLKVETNLSPEAEKAKRSDAADVARKRGQENSPPATASSAEKDETKKAKPETATEGKAELAKDADAKLDAREVLSDAIAVAKSDNKAVFVHFTADW